MRRCADEQAAGCGSHLGRARLLSSETNYGFVVMAPLPKPIPPTVRAIYKAYEEANKPRDGRSISVSTLAEECPRSLWYSFRWTTPHEFIQGRTLRLFETGNIEESRWIDNLRMIGCEVVDQDDRGRQIMVEACDGHVRGYLDSEILGLPEAPKTWHVGALVGSVPKAP